MNSTAPGFGGTHNGTALQDAGTDPARRSFVQRIGTQVSDGTYDPPLEGVVDSLVVALLPALRVRR